MTRNWKYFSLGSFLESGHCSASRGHGGPLSDPVWLEHGESHGFAVESIHPFPGCRGGLQGSVMAKGPTNPPTWSGGTGGPRGSGWGSSRGVLGTGQPAVWPAVGQEGGCCWWAQLQVSKQDFRPCVPTAPWSAPTSTCCRSWAGHGRCTGLRCSSCTGATRRSRGPWACPRMAAPTRPAPPEPSRWRPVCSLFRARGSIFRNSPRRPGVRRPFPGFQTKQKSLSFVRHLEIKKMLHFAAPCEKERV